MTAPAEPLEGESSSLFQRTLGVFRYSRRALALVWSTAPGLAIVLGVATIVAGVLPAAAAWVGQLIVDAVVAAIETREAGGDWDYRPALQWVALEGVIMIGIAGAQRTISACQSLLRALLGQRVNVMILDKAGTLSLSQFEDSELYDKLTRARREASQRPLGLVNKTFGLIQNGISLISFAAILFQFSPWAMLILFVGALPVFLSEAKFSGDAFRLFRWRSPETRMQMYLETVLAREDSVKEVKLFGLGPLLLERYRDIFRRLYREDRALTLRRDGWGFVLGIIGSLTFYGAYAWVVVAAVAGRITLGQMTMYVMVFRQGQSAVSAMLTAISGMYEDNLYLSNLYEYLEQPTATDGGWRSEGVVPGDGVRFEQVGFQYPGAPRPALHDVSFHLRPGQSLALVGANGSGKTTLIKLLTRLYVPSSGRILLDGSPLEEWSIDRLRARIGVIFQDFMRYQMQVGENVGAGDVAAFEDAQRWQRAAHLGQADGFIEALPEGYHTQLGRWFRDGQELSGGQWQKVALARAFMREEADILVLDEPTAAMDAQAEADIFQRFQEYARERMTIIISHRFSTVRIADHILVMDGGTVIESGTHDDLMARDGRYAHLFRLQARGYQ
ncbi:MAG: ABC transporter ATP-binding protein [Algiphilus sp.]|uniref:ABC transporter ATP-binding protein n=1 Tax=Algiphilus sp. TaxID=1872431 RepID=UPI0032ED4A6D